MSIVKAEFLFQNFFINYVNNTLLDLIIYVKSCINHSGKNGFEKIAR